MEHSIVSVCISAVIAIFIILPMLAFIMHFIVLLFPKETKAFQQKQEPVQKSDTAVFAAITTAYSSLYPGTKIKEIMENK